MDGSVLLACIRSRVLNRWASQPCNWSWEAKKLAGYKCHERCILKTTFTNKLMPNRTFIQQITGSDRLASSSDSVDVLDYSLHRGSAVVKFF